jgi:hypothetical protein
MTILSHDYIKILGHGVIGGGVLWLQHNSWFEQLKGSESLTLGFNEVGR